MSFLFGTYYFARKIFAAQCPADSFHAVKSDMDCCSAKKMQENLTLSTKNNVFITFQVSFKSVNRNGNKQFTPSCGSSSLETNPVFHRVKRSYHKLTVSYNCTIFKTRKENIHKTESPEHDVISILGEQVLQVHCASHSVGKGMSWDKILRSKGFVSTRGGSRIFLGGGAFVSCSTSTPITHIVFFCRIPVVLENRTSSQGGRGGAHSLLPPPRSAPDYSDDAVTRAKEEFSYCK